MIAAALHLDPAFVVAPVNRRTFGSFVEHMGRNVYTGIYEPGHPTADSDGFRQDVLELVRELGVTVVRYPGGNFVSGYRWEDGVGPVADRPTRLDPAWRTIETNRFGLGEFARWAAKADVEVMLAVNLGTRGMPEAIELFEYCNHPEGTYLSDLRRSHGAKEPYGIRMWCLGNEMDGPWQLGHKTAEEYGRLAAETARAMRQFDPALELVACGSSSRLMPTFGTWEATVLGLTYDVVDHISAHAYYELEGDDLASFMASAVNMDGFIQDVVATADHVGAKLKSTKRINISFDEWNVWYVKEMHERDLPKDWTVAPRLSEDAYTVADAVVVGSLLVTLLRNSDRVTSACQAQLVNAIGSIRTEPGGPAWRQSIFHPFAEMAAFAKGTVLRTEVETPTYDTPKYGEAPVVDASATFDEERGELVVFAVNRHPSQEARLTVELRAFGGGALEQATVLADDDWRATNTIDEPDRVQSRTHPQAGVNDGVLQAAMPPVSWNVFRLSTTL
jgi:alpha-L-arabinofuranosidase